MTNWTEISKSSAPSWGTIAQNVASWVDTARTMINSCLLREDGSYILREDGYKIIREDSVASQTSWTTINKS